MQRLAANLFFLVGGFLVGTEVLVAFLGGEPGYSDDLGRIAYFSAVSAPFLALGTWLSPGYRWRELGLTVVIGALVCALSLTAVFTLPDEQGSTLRIEPVDSAILAPGIANLVVLLAVGAFLFVRGPSWSGRS